MINLTSARLNASGNVLGTAPKFDFYTAWCYIHGVAERRYVKEGGYDIPQAWGECGDVFPNAPGEYPCRFFFTEGKPEAGTYVAWADRSMQGRVRGYFVLNSDEQGLADARRCAKNGREGN